MWTPARACARTRVRAAMLGPPSPAVSLVPKHPPTSHPLRSQDLFLPLKLATDTRSPRLAAHALTTAQRLVANGAASAEDGEALAGMLAAAARQADETVRLRALQAALTLAQSAVHPVTEAGLGAVLGAVLGLLGGKGNRDVVTATAAATARQVLVLLLGYPDEVDTRAAAVRAVADICAMSAGAGACEGWKEGKGGLGRPGRGHPRRMLRLLPADALPTHPTSQWDATTLPQARAPAGSRSIRCRGRRCSTCWSL